MKRGLWEINREGEREREMDKKVPFMIKSFLNLAKTLNPQFLLRKGSGWGICVMVQDCSSMIWAARCGLHPMTMRLCRSAPNLVQLNSLVQCLGYRSRCWWPGSGPRWSCSTDGLRGLRGLWQKSYAAWQGLPSQIWKSLTWPRRRLTFTATGVCINWTIVKRGFIYSAITMLL